MMAFADDTPVQVPAHQVLLEKVLLHLRLELSEMGYAGMAEDAVTHVARTLAHNAAMHLQTHVLAMPDKCELVSYPANWRQHLKQAVYDWLERRARDGANSCERRFWHWLRYMVLGRRWGWVGEHTQSVKTFKAVCPHLNAGKTREDQNRVCLTWLDEFTWMDQLTIPEEHLQHVINGLKSARDATELTQQHAKGFPRVHVMSYAEQAKCYREAVGRAIQQAELALHAYRDEKATPITEPWRDTGPTGDR